MRLVLVLYVPISTAIVKLPLVPNAPLIVSFWSAIFGFNSVKIHDYQLYAAMLSYVPHIHGPSWKMDENC
jgi:hypothetical protein